MAKRSHEGLWTLLAHGHQAGIYSNVPLPQIDKCRLRRSALVVAVGEAGGSHSG
jgi:hypothetical protein